jgi:hypothetical protein
MISYQRSYSSPHTASVVSSLIKMFLPTIAGCAQVGFSATRYFLVTGLVKFRNVSIALRHLGEKFRLQEETRRPLPTAAAGG